MQLITLTRLHQEVLSLKEDILELRYYFGEDFELSIRAKNQLKKARENPKTVPHEVIEEKYAC